MWINPPQATQAQRDKGTKAAAAMLEKTRKERREAGERAKAEMRQWEQDMFPTDDPTYD